MIAELETIYAKVATESGHWYDPKTGKQVELPPRTRATTAIKLGLVPGVTSITKQAHKEAILRWKVNSAIGFAAKVLREYDDDHIPMQDACLISETWQLLDADSEAITGRGKELHGAIERAICGELYCKDWERHVEAVKQAMSDHGIEFCGSAEHSFATSRYGGKIDFHNDEWLLDYKTKPSIIEGKRLAYPEHAQQLAAYSMGLVGGAYDLPLLMIRRRKCANVFVGVEDAQVVFHEWKERELLQGWREFECLLNYWWCKNDKRP